LAKTKDQEIHRFKHRMMANLQSTTLVSLSIAMWSSHGVANHAIKHAELKGNNAPHTASS
jgi:hypothetical protein